MNEPLLDESGIRIDKASYILVGLAALVMLALVFSAVFPGVVQGGGIDPLPAFRSELQANYRPDPPGLRLQPVSMDLLGEMPPIP